MEALWAITGILGLALLAAIVWSIYDLEEEMALDFAALTAKVDGVVAVVAGIQEDYTNLKAEIDALRAQIDPQAQAKIDALVAKLDAGLAQLTALDQSVPPIPPPGPPA